MSATALEVKDSVLSWSVWSYLEFISGRPRPDVDSSLVLPGAYFSVVPTETL